MNFSEIVNQIKNKKTYLCVGLDSDLEKIPKHLLEFDDPIYEFNKRVIDATKDLVIAYKPNLAFYESQGSKGLISLEKTLNYIPSEILKIADAKRGDIGNTSKMYAKTFFEIFNSDFPIILRGVLTAPFSKNILWILPSLLIINSNFSDNAFTTETPTPCKPPDTL